MKVAFSLVAIAVSLCCCVSPFVKRKRLLCSYGLLLFILCSATYGMVNYIYLRQIPINRKMNLSGFSKETQLALQISESETRVLRLALRELSEVLMALPFVFIIFWGLMHRELVSKASSPSAAEPEADERDNLPGQVLAINDPADFPKMEPVSPQEEAGANAPSSLIHAETEGLFRNSPGE